MMNKAILKLAFLATSSLYAANPKFQAMYESMKAEEKRIQERNDMFKALMEENERYERELASATQRNLEHVSQITQLNKENNVTQKNLKEAQKKLEDTERHLKLERAELKQALHEKADAIQKFERQLESKEKFITKQEHALHHNQQEISRLDAHSKKLQKDLETQEGFFKTTLNHFATAIGLKPILRNVTAKAIQEKIYKVLQEKTAFQQQNQELKKVIAEQRSENEAIKKEVVSLKKQSEEQFQIMHQKDDTIEVLEKKCIQLKTQLEQEIQKSEQSNTFFKEELRNAHGRIQVLEASLASEQKAFDTFKSEAQTAFETMKKHNADTITAALRHMNQKTDEVFNQLFDGAPKRSRSSSEESPKTIKKPSVFFAMLGG